VPYGVSSYAQLFQDYPPTHYEYGTSFNGGSIEGDHPKVFVGAVHTITAARCREGSDEHCFATEKYMVSDGGTTHGLNTGGAVCGEIDVNAADNLVIDHRYYSYDNAGLRVTEKGFSLGRRTDIPLLVRALQMSQAERDSRGPPDTSIPNDFDLVFRHNCSSGDFFVADEWRANSDDPTASKFSILDELSGGKYVSEDGKYEFILSDPEVFFSNHWLQTSNPTSEPRAGYETISAYMGSRFAGLEPYRYAATLMQGDDKTEYSWYSLGTSYNYGGTDGSGCNPGPITMSGWGVVTSEVKLYARRHAACDEGSYLDASTRRCFTCPLGSVSSGGWTDVCVPCTAGSYAAETGSTHCQPCPQNTYQGRSGAASCDTAPPGCIIDPSTRATVEQCPAGTYWTAADAPCNACSPGSFTRVTGATRCSLCSPGSFKAAAGADMCEPCAAGTTSLPGASACHQCPPGTFSPGGAPNCWPCSSGSYADSAGTTMCATCGAGLYAPMEGASECFAG